MIRETYRVMLREYDAKHISVLGTSSGGGSGLRRLSALYSTVNMTSVEGIGCFRCVKG